MTGDGAISPFRFRLHALHEHKSGSNIRVRVTDVGFGPIQDYQRMVGVMDEVNRMEIEMNNGEFLRRRRALSHEPGQA
jgi:hypothetical protein